MLPIVERMRSRWNCVDFQHFVNGVKKENPRYLVEQFSQIEKFLEKEDPDRATVAVVMKVCCEKWRYRFSQFKEVYAAVKNGETGNTGYVPNEVQKLRKAQLIILDEIGYTPISRAQANRFFTFISDTYETSSIIFTTNKEIAEWAEMMGDPVLTTAMLDRILHHAACFSLRGESYRLKHPELFA